MTTCPECGLLYAVHIEHVYTCPNGHTWKWEHEGTITGRLHKDPPPLQPRR